MISPTKYLKKFVSNKNNFLFDIRGKEYLQALKFLDKRIKILDVGCGTGTFLEFMRSNNVNDVEGIDLNPDNVIFAQNRGLKVSEASALDLPFEDNCFDAVYSSHLMQVFNPNDAQKFIQECSRVLRSEGLLIISTLNWFKHFYRHPENERPYPPDAILRYSYSQEESTSPMYEGMPNLVQEDIWYRRPPLIELHPGKSKFFNKVFVVVNHLQLKLRIIKFWAFDSYIIKLRVKK